MSAKAEVRARRKEELLLLARIERIELAEHVRELRRLKKPVNFAMIGANILRTWRSPAWLSTAAALLAARGTGSGRALRLLRYAGYAYAAWRTYGLIRHYVASASRNAPGVAPEAAD